MPLRFIRGGGVIFRHLQSRISRVPVTVSNARRSIYLAANSRLSNLVVNNNHYAQGILSGRFSNSFATARGRPKGRTGKAKKATKRTRGRRSTKAKEKKRVPKVRKQKKELTPEEKEKQGVTALKLKIRQLKKDSLRIPKKRPTSVFLLAVQDKFVEARKNHPVVRDALAVASTEAKSLSTDEKEKYAAIAEKNVSANEIEYKNWCQLYSPLQIKEANMARRRLAKLKNKRLVLIRDDRLVKKPSSPYMMFATEELRAGQSVSACAEKWRTLSEAEKKKYIQQHAEDLKRYEREYKETYGKEVPQKGTQSKRVAA